MNDTDIQDPLPEANWLWRRIFIFGVTTAVIYLVYLSVDRLGTVAVVRPDIGIAAFVSIVKLLVITIDVLVTYYMVAPSAEQITKMMQTAGLLKSGVQIASRVVETPFRRETAQTVAQPPQPVSPPVASEGASETPIAAPDPLQPPAAQDGEASIAPESPISAPSGTDTASEGADLPPGLLPASGGLDTASIIKGA